MSWIVRIFKNIRKRGLKDILKPSKWHVFLQGEAIKEKGITFDLGDGGELILESEEDIVSFCEQFVYRQVLCHVCVKNKSCSHCGCSVPGNMLTPTNECSGGSWGPMMDKEEWDQYKLTTGLNFGITYLK